MLICPEKLRTVAIIQPRKEKNDPKKSKNTCGGHLIFQNEAKNYDRHALGDINLFCKFGEFMFINEGGDVNHFVTLCDGQRPAVGV